MIIEQFTQFNYDGKTWTVIGLGSVRYVHQIGYVVTVGAINEALRPSDPDYHKVIELIANGTPLGYTS
jgi:hypothetical protein